MNKAQRIDDLIDLCERKDKAYLEVISDGLRHGSPIAASETAYRNSYLKNVKH